MLLENSYSERPCLFQVHNGHTENFVWNHRIECQAASHVASYIITLKIDTRPPAASFHPIFSTPATLISKSFSSWGSISKHFKNLNPEYPELCTPRLILLNAFLRKVYIWRIMSPFWSKVPQVATHHWSFASLAGSRWNLKYKWKLKIIFPPI